MARQKEVSLFRSKRMRATLVDAVGRPVYGPESVVTTRGQITTSFTSNVEEGESITATNGNGETCINEKAVPSYTGDSLEATFCKVDFALFTLLTGLPVVRNDDGTIRGIKKSTKIDLSGVNFALELWTGASSEDAPRDGAEGLWGYILAPFVSGGTLGDITVENAAITFTVTGMSTKSGATWGKGPYNVDLVGGVAAPLAEALTADDHVLITTMEIAPPQDFPGFTPLLDLTDPALTGVTATATGLSVAIAPTPAGTDPVWYEFGDGQWDYAETGSYTHVYDTPGTYTITARRGGSVVTTDVTVA
jgi:hypothetical protein